MAKSGEKGLKHTNVDGLFGSDLNMEQTHYSKVTKGGHYDFLDNLIETHHRESMLEHMYQFNDYFSDKYKIRKKITEEIGKKVSLKEINLLLNKMVSEIGKWSLLN